ncbi:MAG: hypothetical protein JXR95_15830 [Deltaproteobacteria bacterium]|nr:hypothetical protein [Deltaproteobacteria bacterium]
MMIKKIQLTIIFISLGFISCGKKTRSIEELESSGNYSALEKIVGSTSETTDRRTSAAISLARRGRYGGIVKIMPGMDTKVRNDILSGVVNWGVSALGKNDDSSVKAKDSFAGMFSFFRKNERDTIIDRVFSWYSGDISSRIEAGDYKLKKCLEIMWNSASEQSRKKISVAHAHWMTADLKKRGHEGVVLFKRGRLDKVDGFRLSPVEKTYRNYFKYFKNEVARSLSSKISPVTSSPVLLLELSTLFDYGTVTQRQKAGTRLLEEMIKTRKFTLVSLRALGDLKPSGASKYLGKLLKPSTQKNVMEAGITALSALTDEEESAELLFNYMKPLINVLRGSSSASQKEMALALMSAKGLELPRKCRINSRYLGNVKNAYSKKLTGDLFELRNSVIKALYRLILCMDGPKGLAFLLNSIKFPVSFEQFRLLVESFNTLDKNILVESLKKELKTKNPAVLVAAIWGISAFGEEKDLQSIQQFSIDKRAIPQWNQTVGDFTLNAVKTLKSKAAKKK